MIDKIKLINYKRFVDKEIDFNDDKNIFVGENGVGKTSILEAIDIVLSGSYGKVEKIGISSLFNTKVISEFLAGEKSLSNLPELIIEVYINNSIENSDINGVHYTLLGSGTKNGLCLKISPNADMSHQLEEALKSTTVFPFEYYSVEFKTFSGRPYNTYNKYKGFIKHAFVRNDILSNKFKMREYIDNVYESSTDEDVRKTINNSFRDNCTTFKDKLYVDKIIHEDSGVDLNLSGDKFFQNNITILNNEGVDVSNIGHGERLIKNMSIKIKKSDNFDILLIEEPENHLSYINMHKLIKMLELNSNIQTFISTHNNMISSRLSLKNVILISEDNVCSLSNISGDTAKFFIKAPNTNLLNFILSKNVILVEGDAEYILLDKFYEMENNKNCFDEDISIISCGGKTFKRYIELAKILNKKVAIITDNDKNYAENITNSYGDYLDDNVSVFSDGNNDNYTFEVCLYTENVATLEDKLKNEHMSNGLQAYMLNNKAESALRLLNLLESDSEFLNSFVIPVYIKEALKWIK